MHVRRGKMDEENNEVNLGKREYGQKHPEIRNYV